MGNIFAVRPGLREGPATFAGSHLDTQPSGGRYDGILGVTAGVEMLKVLSENWVETEFPVGVVNWTNEEGARFPISMVASGVWSGDIPLERAHNLREVGGGSATMKTELERIGYLGKTPASHSARPMGAHFELHIEQGPILETEKKKIGVVQGVQAYRWFTIDVKGRDCHTGTTPFPTRSDALLTASKLILHSHRLATAHPSALASTGILSLTPGSTNTVPGRVRFSLDIRSPSDAVLDALEDALRTDFAAIARGDAAPGSSSLLGGAGTDVSAGCTKGVPCELEWTTDSISPAVVFHDDAVACVRRASGWYDATKGLTRDLTSGAGHDSVYASRRCPTGMIFVPCRDGVSHNPSEYCAPEDCAAGAQVLLGSVLAFDRMRADRRVTWAQEERRA
ncbi:putative hydrolase [Diplodia seriata]|uniref:Putative hydrolase n=1 Tax=Diplodia seriata TaxID=420778 RepID=A0A1S8BD87_9PEZI|nr:putative hydrolase [Diplodia seriata]